MNSSPPIATILNSPTVKQGRVGQKIYSLSCMLHDSLNEDEVDHPVIIMIWNYTRMLQQRVQWEVSQMSLQHANACPGGANSIQYDGNQRSRSIPANLSTYQWPCPSCAYDWWRLSKHFRLLNKLAAGHGTVRLQTFNAVLHEPVNIFISYLKQDVVYKEWLLLYTVWSCQTGEQCSTNIRQVFCIPTLVLQLVLTQMKYQIGKRSLWCCDAELCGELSIIAKC